VKPVRLYTNRGRKEAKKQKEAAGEKKNAMILVDLAPNARRGIERRNYRDVVKGLTGRENKFPEKA